MAQNAQTLALALIALIQNDEGYSAYITYTATEQTIAGVYIFKADDQVVIIDTDNDCVTTIDCDDHRLTTTLKSCEYTARTLLKSLLSGF